MCAITSRTRHPSHRSARSTAPRSGLREIPPVRGAAPRPIRVSVRSCRHSFHRRRLSAPIPIQTGGGAESNRWCCQNHSSSLPAARVREVNENTTVHNPRNKHNTNRIPKQTDTQQHSKNAQTESSQHPRTNRSKPDAAHRCGRYRAASGLLQRSIETTHSKTRKISSSCQPRIGQTAPSLPSSSTPPNRSAGPNPPTPRHTENSSPGASHTASSSAPSWHESAIRCEMNQTSERSLSPFRCDVNGTARPEGNHGSRGADRPTRP